MDDRHVREIEGPAHGPLVIPDLLSRGSGLLRVLLHTVRPHTLLTPPHHGPPERGPLAPSLLRSGSHHAPDGFPKPA